METDKQIKIFLSDSNLFYLNLYEQIFKRNGYTNITNFKKGIDCLEKLHEKPDVIFLDHKAGELNDPGIIKQIKLFDPNIFIVMVLEPEELRGVFNTSDYGIFDYIVKGDDEMEKTANILLRISTIKSKKRKALLSL